MEDPKPGGPKAWRTQSLEDPKPGGPELGGPKAWRTQSLEDPKLGGLRAWRTQRRNREETQHWNPKYPKIRDPKDPKSRKTFRGPKRGFWRRRKKDFGVKSEDFVAEKSWKLQFWKQQRNPTAEPKKPQNWGPKEDEKKRNCEGLKKGILEEGKRGFLGGEKGILGSIPAMQPGKRSCTAAWKELGLIQFPNWGGPPDGGGGGGGGPRVQGPTGTSCS